MGNSYKGSVRDMRYKYDAVVKEIEAWLGVGRLLVVETKWFKDYGKQL